MMALSIVSHWLTLPDYILLHTIEMMKQAAIYVYVFLFNAPVNIGNTSVVLRQI